MGLQPHQPAERNALYRRHLRFAASHLGHREGLVEGFTQRYGLKRLVYAEHHEDIRTAIQRETTMKHWSRAWKVKLILENNPDWIDLYDQLA